MRIKDFVFRAESEGDDHPERATGRTSSVDLTIQMPVPSNLRTDGYQGITLSKGWDDGHGTRDLGF
jgi:hypothetical protein